MAAVADNTQRTDPEIQEHILTREEGLRLLDDNARRYLGMSGEEFVRAWYGGVFDDDPDRPEVMRVASLLPLAGEPKPERAA